MRILSTCLFLLCWMFSLAAEDPLEKRAKVFFEARDYGQAFSIYKDKEEASVQDWSRAIIDYNLGTILLAEKQWNRAIEEMQGIFLEGDPFPLLARNVSTNLGVAFLRKVMEDKSETALQNALKYFSEAVRYDCDLIKAEGGEHCLPPEDLVRMKELAEWQKVQLLAEKRALWLEKSSFSEALFLLKLGLSTLINQASAIEKMDPNDLKNQYAAYLFRQGEALEALWIRFNEDPVFNESREYFNQGLEFLHKGRIGSSIQAFNESKERLKEVQKTSSVHEVDQVLFLYQILFYEDALHERALRDLLEQESSLVVKGEKIEHSLRQLERALQFSKEGKTDLSRLYFADAMQWLQRSKAGKGEGDPLTILEEAVSNQRHAILLQQLAQAAPAMLSVEEALNLLLSAEKEAIASAQPFLKASIDLQRHLYEERMMCQRDPWNTVFPLFFEGLEAADRSVSSLEQKEFYSALSHQEASYQKWAEALELLKQWKTQPPTRQEEEKRSSVQQAIQMLQEMELNDREKEAKKAFKQVEKPW